MIATAAATSPSDDECTDEEVALYAQQHRPKARGDCLTGENAQRPCPWVTCKWHLWHTVGRGRKDGQEKRLPVLPEIDKLPQARLDNSCALDVADSGAHLQEEIAPMFGFTPQRVQQIETAAMVQLKKKLRRAKLSLGPDNGCDTDTAWSEVIRQTVE